MSKTTDRQLTPTNSEKTKSGVYTHKYKGKRQKRGKTRRKGVDTHG